MFSPDAAFRLVIEVFARLQIPFFVSGSVASSAHGLVRAPRDVDLVADVQPRHITGLAAELTKHFYLDPDVIPTEQPFSLIHYDTGYKFDILPLGSGPFEQAQMKRRVPVRISLEAPEPIEVPLASAEDTLLSKLSWFRARGEISDQQWNDIRGIVEIRGDQLDLAYLRHWAPVLHVADLLERALAQRGHRTVA